MDRKTFVYTAAGAIVEICATAFNVGKFTAYCHAPPHIQGAEVH
jgi:hypothetical protein